MENREKTPTDLNEEIQALFIKGINAASLTQFKTVCCQLRQLGENVDFFYQCDSAVAYLIRAKCKPKK
jgi:hypothetical protein